MTSSNYAPFVVRLGGLAVEELDFFDNPLATETVELRRLEERLGEIRARLVDVFHDAVSGEECTRRRRRFLQVKRCCFNGRPMSPFVGRDFWPEMSAAAPELVETALELESKIDEARERLQDLVEAQADREVQGLVGLLESPAFRCGLAVASPQFAERVDRWTSKPPRRTARKGRRGLLSMLRYASRAAFKTSPFSTFTWLGAGEMDEAASAAVAAIRPEDPVLRSQVRLRRQWLDRCAHLLLGYRPFKRTLGLKVNDSLQTLESGQLRFVRPNRWRIDGEEKLLVFEREAVVQTRLRRDLLDRVTGLLETGTETYGELESSLRDDLGEASTALLDQLLDLGFLCVSWPWNVYENHLEARMAEVLRSLPADPPLSAFLEVLEGIVETQRGFLARESHVSDRRFLEKQMNPLMEAAVALSGAEGLSATTRLPRNEIYQDVWFGGSEPVAKVDPAAARRALADVEPLVRYSRLHDPRLDFLHTLGAHLQLSDPGRKRFPFVEVCDVALPLWREYVIFCKERSARGGVGTWNPLGLEALEQLARRREESEVELAACCVDRGDERRIDGERLGRWLDRLPERLTDPLAGPGLFVQPASEDGSLWMLNRVKEGTGRFSSRYTGLMPSELQERYLDAWRARGASPVDGERALWMDIQCIQGDTLNVHQPLTEATLVLPGDEADLPAERRLGLGDLFIEVGSDAWPCLRDGRGRRLLPLHLGGGFSQYMPTLLRWLAAFGPSELTARFPGSLDLEGSDGRRSGRTLIGSVVLHRRRWSLPAGELAEILDDRSGDAFLRVQRWRAEHGLPRRVFVIEPTEGGFAQPQYLDLESPLFVELLRTMLHHESLTFFEMLPEPEQFPRDPEGRRRVTELQLDAPVLEAPMPAKDGSTFLDVSYSVHLSDRFGLDKPNQARARA